MFKKSFSFLFIFMLLSMIIISNGFANEKILNFVTAGDAFSVYLDGEYVGKFEFAKKEKKAVSAENIATTDFAGLIDKDAYTVFCAKSFTETIEKAKLNEQKAIVDSVKIVKERLGLNLLDKNDWAEKGFNMEKPFGFALLDPVSPVIQILFPVNDAKKALESLKEAFSKTPVKLEETTYKDNTMYYASQRRKSLSFSTFKNYLLFIYSEDKNTIALEGVKEIVSFEENNTVKSLPKFKKVCQNLCDAPIMTYFNTENYTFLAKTLKLSKPALLKQLENTENMGIGLFINDIKINLKAYMELKKEDKLLGETDKASNLFKFIPDSIVGGLRVSFDFNEVYKRTKKSMPPMAVKNFTKFEFMVDQILNINIEKDFFGNLGDSSGFFVNNVEFSKYLRAKKTDFTTLIKIKNPEKFKKVFLDFETKAPLTGMIPPQKFSKIEINGNYYLKIMKIYLGIKDNHFIISTVKEHMDKIYNEDASTNLLSTNSKEALKLAQQKNHFWALIKGSNLYRVLGDKLKALGKDISFLNKLELYAKSTNKEKELKFDINLKTTDNSNIIKTLTDAYKTMR